MCEGEEICCFSGGWISDTVTKKHSYKEAPASESLEKISSFCCGTKRKKTYPH